MLWRMVMVSSPIRTSFTTSRTRYLRSGMKSANRESKRKIIADYGSSAPTSGEPEAIVYGVLVFTRLPMKILELSAKNIDPSQPILSLRNRLVSTVIPKQGYSQLKQANRLSGGKQ
jgi:hypothetical protein